MGWIVGVNLTISSLLLFCFIYFGLKSMRWLKVSFQRIESSILPSSSMPVSSLPIPAHYGLRENSVFPDIHVLDMDTQQPTAFELNSRESVVLITLLGCQSCEQTLKQMKIYNFNAFEFDMVVLTFLYPGVYYAEDKIARHNAFLKELTISKKFIVLEETINQLEITSFPTLMRISPDGKVIGTYLADAHQIAPHFQSSGFNIAS